MLWTLWFAPTAAQPTVDSMVVDVWTTADGLPVNGLTDILQTRDGYIWISTWDGFVRFDGVRFTVFNRSNTPGLPDNRTRQLEETEDGILWVLTEHNHLVSFSGGTAHAMGPADGLQGRETGNLFRDRDGRLLAGTDVGLYSWNGESFEEIWRRPPVPATVSELASVVFRDRQGRLWIGMYEGGFFRVDGNKTTHFDKVGAAPIATVLAFQEDHHGRIWLSATPWQTNRSGSLARGLFLVEENVIRPANMGSPNALQPWAAAARVIRPDRSKPAFAFDGVYLEAFRDGSSPWEWGLLDSVPSPPGAQNMYRGWDYLVREDGFALQLPLHPYGVLWDREGSIWLATDGEGLWRYRSVPFQTFGQEEGLPGENVYPLLVDRRGRVWTATLSQDGAFRLDPSGTERAEILAPGEGVLALYEDRHGGVWVGTNTGVCRVVEDPDLCRWLPLPGQQAMSIYAIHEDREGGFWFAGDRRLLRFANGSWSSYPEVFESRLPARHSVFRLSRQSRPQRQRIRSIVEDHRGVLWFGAAIGGVVALRPDGQTGYEGGTWTHLGPEQGLPSEAIRDLHIDSRGYLWVVTEDAGLARLDLPRADVPAQITIVPIQQRDGLPENALHAMLEDAQGRLWVSSNRGLFWIPVDEINAFADGTRSDFRSVLFTERDGLRDKEFNGGYFRGASKGPDGRLWFPSQVGVVAVDPHRARMPDPPAPAIEEISAGGSSRSPGAGVTLKSEDRSFEIDYTALSFLSPADARFRYRLVGYDPDWVDAGARRTAYYTRVPAGTYQFEVSAAGKDGRWAEQPASVRVTVSPFFFETPWFLLLCGVLFLGLIGLGVRWRESHLRLRQAQLEALIDSRTREIVGEKKRTENALETVAAQAERLRLLDASKSRFFANMSHEFRTPLTLILGPLKQVLEQQDLTDPMRSSLGLIQRNGHRLLHLINQLLDLARLDAGALSLQTTRQDPVAFARSCTSLFESLARLRRVDLHFHSEFEGGQATFDEEKMERVLLNLLSNALKFTPEGGRVEVRVSNLGEGGVRFSVADTGIGIPQEHLESIFDRFYQVDGSPTRQREGSGIGLALANELVQLHGGTMTVESQPGQGASFSVWLPATAVTLQPSSAPEAPRARELPEYFHSVPEPLASAPVPGQDGPRPLVLIVEDNADLRAYVGAHLRQSFQILEAANGIDALEAATTHVPDLVLADVMMPQMDGLTLCRRLKNDLRTSHIPVVLLTARDDRPSRIDGLAIGADDYLAKPFDPDELRHRINNLVEQRKMLRSRFSQSVLVLGASEVALPSPEVAFLDRIKETVNERLSDPDFGVDTLAEEVGMSRSQLQRKLLALVGESPGSLIRRIRLERAARLLRVESAQVKTVAGQVGFRSVPHFSEAFRQTFGVAPSGYGDR